MLMISSKQAL